MNRTLINYLKNNGAIQHGVFVGKSGHKYNVETDIRFAFDTNNKSMQTANLILDLLKKHDVPKMPFIGVPETGTVLAFVLNMCQNTDFDYSINMLRASEKPYQQQTKTVNTVFPVNEDQEYILIEDDVVTGNTLLKYLNIALQTGFKIKYVISIFGRSSAVNVKNFCSEQDISYLELINTNEIN